LFFVKYSILSTTDLRGTTPSRKPAAVDRKIVITGEEGFDDPTFTVTKQYNVLLGNKPNGNVPAQHAWLIGLKNVSLQDFQEKMHKLEVVSPTSVVITMPKRSYPELFGNLMCQKDSALLALKASRNRYASESASNEYRIEVEFKHTTVENVFPLGQGEKAKLVEPNLAGALLTMTKQVEVKVQVNDEPMPDPAPSLLSRRSKPAPATRETQIKLVEEEVVTDRSVWVLWSVGIQNTFSYLEWYGPEDDGETEALGDKATDFCKSMSMEDVSTLRSQRKSSRNRL
jgi:hypothetical protein